MKRTDEIGVLPVALYPGMLRDWRTDRDRLAGQKAG